MKIFLNADVPVGTINTVREALAMDTLRERGMIETVRHKTIGSLKMIANPIKLSGSKRTHTVPPPLFGEHTNEILRDLGYSKKEIEQLRGKGVI